MIAAFKNCGFTLWPRNIVFLSFHRYLQGTHKLLHYKIEYQSNTNYFKCFVLILFILLVDISDHFVSIYFMFSSPEHLVLWLG